MTDDNATEYDLVVPLYYWNSMAGLLNPKFLDLIIHRALERRNSVESRSGADTLEKLISGLEIPGFRASKNKKAANLLFAPIRKAALEAVPILPSIIDIWQQLEPELGEAACQFCDENNIEPCWIEDAPIFASDYFSKDQLDGLVLEFQESEFSANVAKLSGRKPSDDEVRLMLCVVTARVAAPEVTAENPTGGPPESGLSLAIRRNEESDWVMQFIGEALSSVPSSLAKIQEVVDLNEDAINFAGLLYMPIPDSLYPDDVEEDGMDIFDVGIELLRALPDDSPRWETVDSFIAEAQSLSAARLTRLQEKESNVALLEGLLQKVLSSISENGLAADFTALNGWSARDLALERHFAAADELANFNQLLDQYVELAGAKAPSLAEKMTLIQNQARQIELLQASYGSLVNLFSAETPASEAKSSDIPEPASDLSLTPAANELTDQDTSARGVHAADTEPAGTPDVAFLQKLDGAVSADVTPFMGDLPVGDAGASQAVAALPGSDPLLSKTADESASAGPIEKPLSRDRNQTEPDVSVTPTAPSDDELGDHAIEPFPAPSELPEPETAAEDLSNVAEVSKTTEAVPAVVPVQPEDVLPQLPHVKTFWDLVSCGDFAGAYWLRVGMGQDGTQLPLDTIRALQASFWLTMNADPRSTELLEWVNNAQRSDNETENLLRLSAAIAASLFAPTANWDSWLKTPSQYPVLNDLVQTLDAFVQSGVAVNGDDLSGVEGGENYKSRLTEVVDEANRWLASINPYHFRYWRASKVWRVNSEPGGRLYDLIHPVAENSTAEYRRIEKMLEDWSDRGKISDQIERMNKEIGGIHLDPIIGTVKDRMIDEIEGLLSRIPSRWIRLLSKQNDRKSMSWTINRLATLRRDLQAQIPAALAEIAPAYEEEKDLSVKASLSVLVRSMLHLVTRLQMKLDQAYELPIPYEPTARIADYAAQMNAAVGYRLLYLPELSLGDDLTLEDDDLMLLPEALENSVSEKRTLASALAKWQEKQDYRFVGDLAAITGTPVNVETLVDISAGALQERIAVVQGEIEQALIDALVTEDERTGFVLNTSISDPRAILNFRRVYTTIEGVQVDLKALRDKRLKSKIEKWAQIDERLERASVDRKLLAAARDQVAEALSRGDTRAVQEYLDYFSSVLESGIDIDPGWLAPIDQTEMQYIFLRNQFLESLTALDAVFKENRIDLASAIHSRGEFGPIRFSNITNEKRSDALDTVSAWRQLRKGNRIEAMEHLKRVLNFLGFRLASDEHAMTLTADQRMNDWLHIRVSMTISQVLTRLFPQFGTMTKGLYDVVVAYERPSADNLNALIHDLNLSSRGVLVLYLGRLGAARRKALSATLKEREISIAVLDDSLLAFLCSVTTARLPVFLRCAMPFSSMNPYTPFQAGDCPPEMFSGREDMIAEIKRESGSCLVYGGRQLGKSALLRQAQREFNQPEIGHHAWIENMKLVYDPQARKDLKNVWKVIKTAFVQRGLIETRISDEPPGLTDAIRYTFQKNPSYRVLVCFDEADDFLDADAHNEFRITRALNELMRDTDHRLKIVFAGLHNVQRFQGIPNQPLAHYGAPLCVKPLEPKAAKNLIIQPFEALGYVFKDNITVMRILSYTNYHPGLIQFFCQELIKSVQRQNTNGIVPFVIESSHIEAIYRNPETRTTIRERLELTLALDHRYQSIAWSLIVDQMSRRNGYSRIYTPRQINEIVAGWWPKGFENVNLEQFRTILDEMTGLGVLVKTTEGSYRLRSPNLISLMGSEEDLGTQLLQLSDKSLPPAVDLDSFHGGIEEAGVLKGYSPLSLSQEASLAQLTFGVGIVLASPLSGIEDLSTVCKSFIPQDLPREKALFNEIPSWVNEGKELTDLLEHQHNSNPKAQRIINVFVPEICDSGSLAELVNAAITFSHIHQSGKRSCRVIFLLNPVNAMRWMSIPEPLRQELESKSDAVIVPNRWNKVGIHQRLVRLEKLSIEDAAEKVLKSTGGWHYLVEKLFSACGDNQDPRPASAAIESALQNAGSPLHQSMLDLISESVTLPDHIEVDAVFKLFLREGSMTLDLVTPDFLESPQGITLAQCQTAVEYLVRLGLVNRTGALLEIDPVVKQVVA